METVYIVYITNVVTRTSNGAFSLCCYVSLAFCQDWPEQLLAVLLGTV